MEDSRERPDSCSEFYTLLVKGKHILLSVH